jgi:alpha-mannosidase
MKTQSKLATLLLGLSLAFAGNLAAQTSSQKQPERPVDLSRDKNLYMIGYAHLDTQWRWTYPQVIRDFIANTMRQNFPLFEKYPDYVFNFTGSRRYEFMKEYYPEDYEKVKKYLAEGRWFPAGSSVDENDANVPSLESFVRHFLYGNRFFKKEFGVQSQEFMLPDCFGFPASLPSILAHGGIKGFSTQKLTWGSAVGIPFNVGVWTGPDGSSVVAALNPLGYGDSITEDLSHSEMWLKRIDETGQKSGAYADYRYYPGFPRFALQINVIQIH